jgi:protein O-mannosyl-transferase
MAVKWRWAESVLFACACIVLLGILVYSNTLQVPWYFDDTSNIVENGVIRDLGKAWRYLLSSGRGLAQLTFALNYRIGDLDVTGYHLVNLVFHLTTSCVVLLILRRIFPTSSRLPLLGALLFLVHPLQTQAVTYVVQRMTSLSGLFFFLALYLFIRAREALATAGRIFSARHLFFYLAALGCGALAVLVKENAAILPLALLLFDRYFLPAEDESKKRRLCYILPFIIVPLGLAVQEILFPLLHGTSLGALGKTLDLASQRHVTVLNYLVTELSVVWTYLRLLFLPYGQALDYGYPVAEHLLTGKNILAFLGVAGLLGTAFSCRRKAPLISFGIFWFLLALSVESTFIPLDPLFEHRLYVPLFGFVLVVIGLLRLLLPPNRVEFVLLIMILLLAVTAWRRNALWNDPIAFHEDNLRQVPWSERVRVSLAKAYMVAGRNDDAQIRLEEALQINPGYDYIYLNLGLIQIDKGQFDRAMATLQKGVQINPERTEFYDFIGFLYYKLGQPELAIRSLRHAIEIGPLYPNAYLNLGTVYTTVGDLSAALECFQKAIALSHESVMGHYNLGVVYLQLNRRREAQQEFLLVTQKTPDDAEALYNLAMTSLKLGEPQPARAALSRLQQLNSAAAAELRKQLLLYDQQ